MSSRLRVHTEYWKSRAPFRISGRTWEGFDLVVCEVRDDGLTGRGEAAGVFYLDETPELMQQQIAGVMRELQYGLDRNKLMDLLPPGGARNALDCALWDLEARRSRSRPYSPSASRTRPRRWRPRPRPRATARC